MCFKANWIFFILFSLKSHKASNLVARKQVPFCSYFLVLSLPALFLWISSLWWHCLLQSQCQVDRWLPAGCLCSPMASEGLFLPCVQGLEVSGTPNSLLPWRAGEHGGDGWCCRCSWGSARWVTAALVQQSRLSSVAEALHLRSALLAYQTTLTLALEIETHLKGNSSFWSLIFESRVMCCGSELQLVISLSSESTPGFHSLSLVLLEAWCEPQTGMQNTRVLFCSANLMYVTYFSTSTDR